LSAETTPAAVAMMFELYVDKFNLIRFKEGRIELKEVIYPPE